MGLLADMSRVVRPMIGLVAPHSQAQLLPNETLGTQEQTCRASVTHDNPTKSFDVASKLWVLLLK